MQPEYPRPWKERAEAYFRENPGTLLIAGFELALLAIIIVVLFGNLGLANTIAVYAYYPLLLGIGIQLVIALRAEREKGKPERKE